MRMRHYVGRVVTDGADIAEMIVQALKLKKQRAQVSGPNRHIDVKQVFHRLAVRQTMPDRRVGRTPARRAAPRPSCAAAQRVFQRPGASKSVGPRVA